MVIITGSKDKLDEAKALKKLKKTLVFQIENGALDSYFDLIVETEFDGMYNYFTRFRKLKEKHIYVHTGDNNKPLPPNNGLISRPKISELFTKGEQYIYSRELPDPDKYGLIGLIE